MLLDTGAQISEAMMSAPSRASRTACDRPWARAAPVMNATRPCSDPACAATCVPFAACQASSETETCSSWPNGSDFGDDSCPPGGVFLFGDRTGGAQRLQFL